MLQFDAWFRGLIIIAGLIALVALGSWLLELYRRR